MTTLHRTAQKGVALAHIVQAAFYTVIALCWIALALWLASRLSSNWLWNIVEALLALQGLATLTRAGQIYLQAKSVAPDPRTRT